MDTPRSAHINLDHAATTRPEPAVVEAVSRCMLDWDANPSAAYSDAGAARRVLREAREVFSAMLTCTPQELYFTSCGTESNNWALHQAAGKHVVLSAMEHKSVLLAAEAQGCNISLVPPKPDGTVSPEAVERALRADTALLSVQFANNETGVLQPVAELGALAKSRGIPFHCDAVQALGHVPIDVESCHIDMLSASAHKLYGPRGVGLLYIRAGVACLPFLAGGGQERDLRGGTENTPGIHGFRVAAELANDDMANRAKRESDLRELLTAELVHRVPGAVELCAHSPRLPGIVSVLLPGLSGEEVIAALDLQGIRVSGGAACAARSGRPSHVLRALGLSEEQAGRVIRLSLGRHTTREEVLTAATAIAGLFHPQI